MRKADNGKAADDKLVLGPFDLVITDLEMPENVASLEATMKDLERQYIHTDLRKHNLIKK